MVRIVTLTALLVLLALGCSTSGSHSSAAEPRTPPSTETSSVTVPQWLQVYAQLSGQTMEVSEGVSKSAVTLKVPPYPALTRSQALKFMEKILRDQAGIIVTHPDPNVAVFKLKKHHK